MENKLFRVKFRRLVNCREPLHSILFDQSTWSNYYPVAITRLEFVPLPNLDLPSSMQLVLGCESCQFSHERGFHGILPFKLMEKSFLKGHFHLNSHDSDAFLMEIELLLSWQWDNDFLGFSTNDRVLLPFANGAMLECFDGIAQFLLYPPPPPQNNNDAANRYHSISLEDVKSAKEISHEFHCLHPTFFFKLNGDKIKFFSIFWGFFSFVMNPPLPCTEKK